MNATRTIAIELDDDGRPTCDVQHCATCRRVLPVAAECPLVHSGDVASSERPCELVTLPLRRHHDKRATTQGVDFAAIPAAPDRPPQL